nr:MATE family efflux transporter [Psychrobacter sp. PraFG1]UNK06208.1 MATE family efflux transporter [Psychrobacter sp. PraFG1]
MSPPLFWPKKLGKHKYRCLAPQSFGVIPPQDLTLRLKQIYAADKMLSLFSLNKDIFIRTILLTLSFAWITRLSAQQGDLVMATNALLLQVLSISAFALDGVAVAAESLSGQAAARKGRDQFITALKRTGVITFLLALSLSIIWAFVLPYF